MKTLIVTGIAVLGFAFGLSACSQPGHVWGIDGGRRIADINKPMQFQKPEIRWAQGKSATELFTLWKQIGDKGLASLALNEQQKAFNIEEAIGFRLRDVGDNDPAYTLIREYALSKNNTGVAGLLPDIATCKAVGIYKSAQRKWGRDSSAYTNNGLIEMGIYHSHLYVMQDIVPPYGAVPPPRESLCDCLKYSSGGCPK